MIPVLGIPALNHPDLLRRLLRSIDVPVERLVVIDNSATGEMADAAFDVRPDAVLVEPGGNLGVAASWNHVIRVTADAPWWCLVNVDVEFAPGDLERLADAMQRADPVVACLVEFGAFGVNRAALGDVGWFDENFHPIYCEDTDYRRRCALVGVPILDLPSGATHVGSVSYRGTRHERDNARTYPANVDYYRRKWGGWIGQEAFTTPFDEGGSVADWRLHLDRLSLLRWGD